MKKALKIIGIVLGVLILLLFLTPFLFKGQIKDMVRKTANDNLNAQLSFEDLHLSLLRNFPNATLSLDNLLIINNAPFEGDTLVSSEELVLQMSVMELFNSSEEGMRVDRIRVHNTFLNIMVDSLGNANYDIALQAEEPVSADTSSTGFQFDVQHYAISDSRINYYDQSSKIFLTLEEFNHQGTGDFSASTSTLETQSNALVSFAMDGTQYLNRHRLQLLADFEMDLENMRFTFLENEALVNQLPLRFDGFVQVNEDNNEIDLSFATPSSDFKNFLAVIPEEYSKNIEDVQTTGDFSLEGEIKGIVDETHIPKLDIRMASNNASFKYPDLPKAVEDIIINAQVKNETGIVEDTYVEINNLNFRIDQDRFSGNATIRNLMENMLVDLSANGSINLANLDQAYPLELEQDLNGILTADLTASFDMNSLENEQYQNVRSSGTASLTNFRYTSPEFPNPIELTAAQISMQGGNVNLRTLEAQSGQTDLTASGTIENLMGFLFTDQVLKGRFQVTSDTFSVNDFMVAQQEEDPAQAQQEQSDQGAPTTTEAIKIPSFLDVSLAFNANRVLYDHLELRNLKGNVSIANETASLSNVTSNLFGGVISVDGEVSTGEQIPTFDFNLGLQTIDIVSAFEDLELLQNLAPIIQALQGELNTTISLTGNLNNDLTPQLQSLAGNAAAEIIGAQVNPQQTPLLSRLDNQLNFIDLNNLSLNNLSTQLSFNNGQVEVSPFDFNIKGIQATVSGTHGFDMNMNYTLNLEVPAHLLGSDINNALASLTRQELQNTMIEVPVGLSGTFQNPSINLNMEAAITSLTQEIVERQKENLRERGRDVITDIINRNTNRTPSDTTATGQQDTTQTSEPERQDQVKEAARNILGNILGRRNQARDTTDQ